MDVNIARSLFEYDSDTGVIRWRVSRGKAKAGSEAGCLDGQGYRIITAFGVIYQAHRLAWLLHYGAWPISELDHKNRDKANNRILNLREATRSQNACNSAPPVSKSSGFRGVTKHRNGRWQASIKVKGRSIYLGLFDDVEDAHAVYCAAQMTHHGNFRRAA